MTNISVVVCGPEHKFQVVYEVMRKRAQLDHPHLHPVSPTLLALYRTSHAKVLFSPLLLLFPALRTRWSRLSFSSGPKRLWLFPGSCTPGGGSISHNHHRHHHGHT